MLRNFICTTKKDIHVYTINFNLAHFQHGPCIFIFWSVVGSLYNDISHYVFAWNVYYIRGEMWVHCIVGVTAFSLNRPCLCCWEVRRIQIKLSKPILLPIIRTISFKVYKIISSVIIVLNSYIENMHI